VGGINVSSVLGVMFLEVLWVADEYRKRGLARRLVWEAERLAEKAGCVGAGTWTFSFQGPEFYPKAGYELIGIYDGYPFGITEHVLMKRLPDRRKPSHDDKRDGFDIIGEPAQEDMKVVHDGFHQSCVASAGDEMHNPGITVQLVLRDSAGTIVGGLLASTTIRIMAIEHLWVSVRYRGQGYGRALMTEAERIAQAHGCIAAQATCFSFQTPAFFSGTGYGTFGVADVYPDGITEDYLIKRF
jgi:GNAT superfamily N-acetyltransferase